MEERYYNNSRIVRELREAALIERGFLYTAWQIAVRPGAALQQILTGDRGRFQDPVKFLFICVAMAAVMMNSDIARQALVANGPVASKSPEPKMQVAEQQLADIVADPQSKRDTRFRATKALRELQTTVAEWATQETFKWMNVAMLLAVPFYALGTWLVFNRKFCFAEHLVISGYLYGVQCLLSLATIPIYFWSINAASVVYFVSSTAYQFFAWRQVFKISGWREWIGCVVLLVGITISYLVVATILGVFFVIAILLLET